MDNAFTRYDMAEAFTHYEKESLRIGFSGCRDHVLSPFSRGTRLEMNPEYATTLSRRTMNLSMVE